MIKVKIPNRCEHCDGEAYIQECEKVSANRNNARIVITLKDGVTEDYKFGYPTVCFIINQFVQVNETRHP